MRKTTKKLALNKETLKLLSDPEEALGRVRGGELGAEVEEDATRRRTFCLGSCNCGVS